MMSAVELTERTEDGRRLATLLWRAGPGWRMLSTAVLGGGLGERLWFLNAQVPGGYARLDPVAHLKEIAAPLNVEGPGVGLMTAADVRAWTRAAESGVWTAATVGIGTPSWAAFPPNPPDPRPPATAKAETAEGSAPAPSFGSPAADGPEVGGGLGPLSSPGVPGTINLLVVVPVAFADAALVNLVGTVTEAKVQALLAAGHAATGTPTDAVCVAVRTEGPAEAFGGPRSTWGARVARAVYAAVLDGARADRARRERLGP